MNRAKIYTMYHVHTHLSNCTTNVDSVTKPEEYIQFAVDNGMKALAFSEHGNAFNWLKKKEMCEKAGLKYIHGVEMYITEALKVKFEEKLSDNASKIEVKSVRDNYHVGLYARNWEGVKEINKLISKSHNREDGSFYYNPRISFHDLTQTSDNIIITTACVGGILRRKKQATRIYKDYLDFLTRNKHRCFLEIQPHLDEVQINYNKKLKEISKETGIRLIAGTDTHALNEKHELGRKLLQKRKHIHFDGEDTWILRAMTYDEVFHCFYKQGIFTNEEIEDALENTNVLANMVEEFEMDRSYKYPKLTDNPYDTLRHLIGKGAREKGIDKWKNYLSEYVPRIKKELEIYLYNGAIDFLLLDYDIKNAMKSQGYYHGPGRGSVTGSLVAYLIGLTELDPIKEGLNFERFMNKERISLADIDTDWCPSEREFVKDYIYRKNGLYCADIVTFNTIATKGSVRDVCAVLFQEEVPQELLEKAENDIKNLGRVTDWTQAEIDKYSKKAKDIANYICSNVDSDEELMRREYPEVFEYVDIINGTIVSLGIHPCGTVVSPIPLDEVVGLVTVKTSNRPVTMLNMKEIDSLNFVKLDILGLDNLEIINKTCDLAGIERLTPDNVPMDDNVWKAIAEDTTCIFQWESSSASKYIERLFSDETISRIKAIYPNFKYIDLFSVGNGAIRPAGASYREQLAQGIFHDNGHPALNEMLAPTLGYLVYQEQIIQFLNQFCGYTLGEADIVRRAFSKKTGTEMHLPKIKSSFIKTMKEKYGVEEEEAEKIIVDFLQVIEDASDYLFSLNHAQAYSYIGYINGYLREHYPLEFLTVSLNVFDENLEKTSEIMNYIKKKGIDIEKPTYGKSRAEYFFDKETNSIYKGLKSIKYINNDIAEELYNISKQYDIMNFIDLATMNIGANSRQLETLVKVGYFREFGTIKDLLKVFDIVKKFNKKSFRKERVPFAIDAIRKFASSETEKSFTGVDGISLCKFMYEQQKTGEEFPINILAQFEASLTGSVSLIDSSMDRRQCLVLSVDTKHTPKLKLYRYQNGDIIEVMVYKKDFREKPLKDFDSIFVATCNKKARKTLDKETNKWVETNDFRFYITYYKTY